MSGGRADRDVRLRLELDAVPGSVALVRSVIATVARTADLDRQIVDDILTAASEACNNVVLHAYSDVPGPLIFSLSMGDGWIDAVVRDHGAGIHPGRGRSGGLGMGVTLINTLADRAEFVSAATGTEVRMRFRRPVETARPLAGVSSELWELTDPRSSAALQVRSG